MSQIQRSKYNFRTVGLALILFYSVGFPLSIAHEYGHVLPCLVEGYSAQVWFDLSGAHTKCSSLPKNEVLFSALGPAVGLLSAAIPLAVLRFKSPAIAGSIRTALMIALAAWSIDQGVKIPIEIANLPLASYGITIMILQNAILITLILIFATRRRTEQAAKQIG